MTRSGEGEIDADELRTRAEIRFLSTRIQSLADLIHSNEVVGGTRMAPITEGAVLQLGVAVLIPIAPMLLTMMPLEQLLRKLLGVLSAA